MASYANDYLLDLLLSSLDTEGNRLDICSQLPATFTEATVTYSLGNKTGITVSAPGNRTPTGRKVTVSAITDGSVTDTDDATHWAITDTGNSRLLCAAPLSAPQAVTSGNVFTLPAIDIGIPDPT